MGELYRLDFASGKSYIGITTKTAKRRFKQHLRDHTRHDLLVYRAWKAHGTPTLVVLSVLDNSKLMDAEVTAIRVFRTLSPNGYNSTIGGDRSPALMPDVAKKIGDRHRGRVMSAEWIAKISAGGKGLKRSEETRRRISEGQTGRKMSPESIEKNVRSRAANRGPMVLPEPVRAKSGWKHSEETKEKMRKAAIGKPKSAEHRANLSASRMGMKLTEETLAKILAARVGYRHSPGTIQKMRDAWDRRRKRDEVSGS